MERTAEAPHKTVVNVWDVEGPYYPGDAVTAMVGAKCLSGCALGNKAVVALNGRGEAVARTALPVDAAGAGLAQATLAFTAPDEPGCYRYEVVLEPDGEHLAATKALRFAVVPPADRTFTLHVYDEKTDKPLSGTTAYLYNRSLEKMRPQAVNGGDDGTIALSLSSACDYDVLIERENYNEGGCSIAAGSKAESERVPMLCVVYNKEVLGRPGYDPY